VIAHCLHVAAELSADLLHAPGGRIAAEVVVGLVAWGLGLPPLAIPAAERGLWRLLLARFAEGDRLPAVAYAAGRFTALVADVARVPA
jgi:hypothetical protein